MAYTYIMISIIYYKYSNIVNNILKHLFYCFINIYIYVYNAKHISYLSL